MKVKIKKNSNEAKSPKANAQTVKKNLIHGSYYVGDEWENIKCPLAKTVTAVHSSETRLSKITCEWCLVEIDRLLERGELEVQPNQYEKDSLYKTGIGRVYIYYTENRTSSANNDGYDGSEDSEDRDENQNFQSVSLTGGQHPNYLPTYMLGSPKVGEKVYVSLCRYTSGSTFGSVSGQLDTGGVFKTHEEAQAQEGKLKKRYAGYFDSMDDFFVVEAILQP